MFGHTVVDLTTTGLAAALLLGLVGCDPMVPCVGSGEGMCPAGQFCKVSQDSQLTCDAPGAVGVCTPVPELCTLAFSPVCGCDGVTYANPCMADSAGVNVARTGECDDGLCCDPATMPGADGNPPCVEGVTCCGDGQWRCNESGATTTCDTVGSKCSEVCGGIAGTVCTDSRMYCKMNVAECCCDFQGICVPRPEACIEIFDPVCGCDDVTYSNDCFAAAAGVSIDHTGECGN